LGFQGLVGFIARLCFRAPAGRDIGFWFWFSKELVSGFRMFGFGLFFGYWIFSFSLVADTKKHQQRAEKNRTLCYC
jgi:hypothetical protein